MMQSINALSLTAHVNDWLTASHESRILHIFDRACNLINEHAEILSIVTPQIGNGPFNLVIPKLRKSFGGLSGLGAAQQTSEVSFDHIDLQSPVSHSTHQLTLGNFTISTSNTTPWDPRPDWEKLQTNRDHIVDRIHQVPITNYLTNGSLQSPVSGLRIVALWDQFSSSLATSDLPDSIAVAKRLAGLGPGLTPAGDDFLMGALYAARIIHPPGIAGPLVKEIAETAAPLTTSLSSAWLRSAGNGEAGILWHELFDALISPNRNQIQIGIDKILGVGATSGADALAGLIGTLISYAESHRKHVLP